MSTPASSGSCSACACAYAGATPAQLLATNKIAGIFEEDTHGEYPAGIVEGDVSYGNVFYTTKGGVETAKNTGKKHYREILVELKD